MTGARPIGYLVSRYPSLSHTFIRREVVALRAAGVDVRTCSVRLVTAVNGEQDRAELARTGHLLPLGLRDALGLAADVVRHPAAVLATARWAVRTAPPGLRARVWRLFYVAEAVLARRWCRARGIRHLHVHFANVAADVAMLATRLRRQLGEPASWSFTMHGPTELADTTAFALRQKVEDAAMVACISDYCRSQLMALVPPARWADLVVVRCGLDPESFETSPRHMPGDRLRLVSVGRLVPEKGFAVLIAAMAMLDERGVPADLTVVGDGPERGALDQLARDAGVEGRVTFVGALPSEAVPSVMAAADVFVSASFAEGLPVVIMEAMAAGLATVATRIAGVGELVVDGETGLLVSPGRPDLIADAVEHLWRDPARRAALASAGHARVRTQHDIRCTSEVLARELKRRGV